MAPLWCRSKNNIATIYFTHLRSARCTLTPNFPLAIIFIWADSFLIEILPDFLIKGGIETDWTSSQRNQSNSLLIELWRSFWCSKFTHSTVNHTCLFFYFNTSTAAFWGIPREPDETRPPNVTDWLTRWHTTIWTIRTCIEYRTRNHDQKLEARNSFHQVHLWKLLSRTSHRNRQNVNNCERNLKTSPFRNRITHVFLLFSFYSLSTLLSYFLISHFRIITHYSIRRIGTYSYF